MVQKLQKNMAALACALLSALALSTSVSACFSGVYQPEEPKCLRDE